MVYVLCTLLSTLYLLMLLRSVQILISEEFSFFQAFIIHHQHRQRKMYGGSLKAVKVCTGSVCWVNLRSTTNTPRF